MVSLERDWAFFILLPCTKATGALWRDTTCLLKKPTAAGDRCVGELRDTKLRQRLH